MKNFTVRAVKRLIYSFLLISVIAGLPSTGVAAIASESDGEGGGTDFILHHIKDSYYWHFFDIGEHPVSLSLPVILWTDNGLVTFSSYKFHHDDEGKEVVEAGGLKFVKYHEKVYQAADAPNENGSFIEKDEKGKIENAKPFSMSITKNVAMLFLTLAVVLFIMLNVASNYKKNPNSAPKGMASVFEPIIIYVRDEIAKPNIGPKYKRFMPYLLTLFFFIWIGNLLGLLPGAANLTGNIAITMCLALFTFVATNLNGNKEYWKHIFATPGVPLPLLPILVPVEIIGIFTKPFSLMVRLFVAITAGHIVILSLIGLAFIFSSYAVGIGSTIMVIFINIIELLVATIQAYVFTLFSSMYIGAAVAEHHHEEHH
jgi:F-type H+-transporting ATPase subunit a